MIINPTAGSLGIIANEESNKLASILFDKIIPLNKPELVPRDLLHEISINHELNVKINNIRSGYISELFEQNNPLQKLEIYSYDDLPTEKKVEYERYYRNEILSEIFLITRLARMNDTIVIPVYDPIGFKLKNSFPHEQVKSKQVEVELINAPIINVEDVDWDQILEAKKDPKFRDKVRNFSLFINEDYSNKSMDYIQDSLIQKIENYKSTIEKHGFKMANGTIREIINSKSLWGTTSLILLSCLFATPAFAMTTGLVGAAIELGNLTMKISEQESMIANFIEKSEIAILIELEKMKL